MMRLFYVLLFSSILLRAEDQLILDAHIRMIPKIMALDTQLTPRTDSSKKVVLGVVYDKNRKSSAQEIADAINRLYSGRVGNLAFIATAVSSTEFTERQDIAFAYLIEMNEAAVRHVSSWATGRSIPTFAYDAETLDFGVLGAISIERSTVIYLNKRVLKSGKFRFHDSLLQIARFVE